MQRKLDRHAGRNSSCVEPPKVSKRLSVSANVDTRRARCYSCSGQGTAGNSFTKHCRLKINARKRLILEELRINLVNILLQTQTRQLRPVGIGLVESFL